MSGRGASMPPARRPAAPARARDLSVAARGLPQSVFAFNAREFACVACAERFRHFGELLAHRRAAHRSVVFDDWFRSPCACDALFRGRTDALLHSERCTAAAAVPTPTTTRPPPPENTEEDDDQATDAPVGAASGTRAPADDAASTRASLSLARQVRFPRACPRCCALLPDARTWRTHAGACADPPAPLPTPTTTAQAQDHAQDQDQDDNDDEAFYDAVASFEHDTRVFSDDDDDTHEFLTAPTDSFDAAAGIEPVSAASIARARARLRAPSTDDPDPDDSTSDWTPPRSMFDAAWTPAATTTIPPTRRLRAPSDDDTDSDQEDHDDQDDEDSHADRRTQRWPETPYLFVPDFTLLRGPSADPPATETSVETAAITTTATTSTTTRDDADNDDKTDETETVAPPTTPPRELRLRAPSSDDEMDEHDENDETMDVNDDKTDEIDETMYEIDETMDENENDVEDDENDRNENGMDEDETMRDDPPEAAEADDTTEGERHAADEDDKDAEDPPERILTPRPWRPVANHGQHGHTDEADEDPADANGADEDEDRDRDDEDEDRDDARADKDDEDEDHAHDDDDDDQDTTPESPRAPARRILIARQWMPLPTPTAACLRSLAAPPPPPSESTAAAAAEATANAIIAAVLAETDDQYEPMEDTETTTTIETTTRDETSTTTRDETRTTTRDGTSTTTRYGTSTPTTTRTTTTTTDEETKTANDDRDDESSVPFGGTETRPWVLRFDGAFKERGRQAGSGSALLRPDGRIFWTMHQYLPGPRETNNTAEYNGLLQGLQGAVHHGVKHLRIEGDSTLVIKQVDSKMVCGVPALRRLRDRCKAVLDELESYTLRFIDRQLNAKADGLANAAVRQRNTVSVCAAHPSAADAVQCWPWSHDTQPTDMEIDATGPTTTDVRQEDQDHDMHGDDEDHDEDQQEDHDMNGDDDDETAAADEINARRDGGTVYPVLRVGPGVVPERQPRVRIPRLLPPEEKSLEKRIKTLARTMASKIADAPDWHSAEGYITAATTELADLIRKTAKDTATKTKAPAEEGQGETETATTRPRPTTSTTARATTRPEDATTDTVNSSTTTTTNTTNTTSTQRPTAGTKTKKGRRRGKTKRKATQSGPTLLQLALNGARDELQAARHVADTSSHDARRRIQKAARRVQRIQRAMRRHELRSLFMSDQRRCIQRILRSTTTTKTTTTEHDDEEEDDRCPIPPQDLHDYFQTQATPPSDFDYDADCGARFREQIAAQPEAIHERESLLEPPSRDEIEDRLDRAHKDSAPGLDGIPYTVYVRFKGQLLDLLHAMFTACWHHRRVPGAWKVGFVTLIYKKGSPENPSNWRPICLQQTVYKLYAGVLSTRFQRWMDANSRFTFSQKGFRAFNGCNEHNFLATTLREQCRRTQRMLFVVWYDLRNAFGSLPQAYMWNVLGALGVPFRFLSLVRDLYTDSHFVVSARDGTTDPVHQGRGVYQGCPLSPYLFIAALTPLMFELDSMQREHGVKLAAGVAPCASSYADDLKVFSNSAAGARALHETVMAFLQWTRMQANASKCALMVSDGASAAERENTRLTLRIDGEPVPRILSEDGYTYLGIQDGPDYERTRVVLQDTLRDLAADAIKLMKSPLAPWQVIQALKTHVYSKLDYPLRHLRPFPSMFDGFDRTIKRGLKRLLQLPDTATNELLYAPTSAGGLGLLPLTELKGALKLAHGLQMLHSSDPEIRAIARGQVLSIVQKRYVVNDLHWANREDELIQAFLNNELKTDDYAIKKKASGDVGSLWVDIADWLQATNKDKRNDTTAIKLVTDEHGVHLRLQVPHVKKPLEPKAWVREIKTHLRLQHLQQWKGMVDQGKTVRLHGGAGSSFLTRQSGVYDCSLRFAVRARLNQVDTYSVLKRKGIKKNNRCRVHGCQDTETLAHVLNHCVHGADAIRVRHDEALTIIKHRIDSEQRRSGRTHRRLLVDTTVPGTEETDERTALLRPDIQLYDDKDMTASIVDLAIAFETQATDDAASSNFETVRTTKEAKYAVLKQFLEFKGYTVTVSALLYGSLGSVSQRNYNVYTEELGMRKGVTRALETQLSARNINFSHRIWKRHALANTKTKLLNTSSSTAAPTTTTTTTRPSQGPRRGQGPGPGPSSEQGGRPQPRRDQGRRQQQMQQQEQQPEQQQRQQRQPARDANPATTTTRSNRQATKTTTKKTPRATSTGAATRTVTVTTATTAATSNSNRTSGSTKQQQKTKTTTQTTTTPTMTTTQAPRTTTTTTTKKKTTPTTTTTKTKTPKTTSNARTTAHSAARADAVPLGRHNATPRAPSAKGRTQQQGQERRYVPVRAREKH